MLSNIINIRILPSGSSDYNASVAFNLFYYVILLSSKSI